MFRANNKVVRHGSDVLDDRSAGQVSAEASFLVGSGVFSEPFSGSTLNSEHVGRGKPPAAARLRSTMVRRSSTRPWRTTPMPPATTPSTSAVRPMIGGPKSRLTQSRCRRRPRRIDSTVCWTDSPRRPRADGRTKVSTWFWKPPQTPTALILAGTGGIMTPIVVPIVVGSGAYGVSYDLQLHRRTDNTVDIYMNGNLLANEALIDGVNPTQLRMGDLSSLAVGGDVVYGPIHLRFVFHGARAV